MDTNVVLVVMAQQTKDTMRKIQMEALALPLVTTAVAAEALDLWALERLLVLAATAAQGFPHLSLVLLLAVQVVAVAQDGKLGQLKERLRMEAATVLITEPPQPDPQVQLTPEVAAVQDTLAATADQA